MFTSIRRVQRPLLLFALLALPGAAEPRAQAAAQDSLVPVLDRLAERVEKGSFHGAVAIVEVDGERILEEAFGVRRLEPEAPMELDSIFRIYSMTKPVTSVAALILYEEERFALDDPVSRYLPEFAHMTVGAERTPAEREMTVRDLMRHTSGLTYGIFADSEVDTMVREADVLAPGSSLADMVTKLGGLPLKHHPGTQFEYSLSSDVLGRLVEVLSETTLDRFFEERVFAPLGMIDTGFSVAPEKRERIAEVHTRGPGGLRPSAGFDENDPTERPALLSGGGGLFSTADDYMRFANMLLNGGELGGKRILKADTAALMIRDHLGEISSGGLLLGSSGFGLGVAVINQESSSGPNLGTCWWGGAAGTGFWIDPEARMVGVFMIQNMMELMHTATFQNDVYGTLGR